MKGQGGRRRNEAGFRSRTTLSREEEKNGGKIMVISREHPAGERFLSMGGVAALLRYKLTE